MDIISVSNQKGGVSKTGVSFNLGTALALKHSQKVLLIDLDPQANLSEYLKYEPDGKPTLTQLVMTACTGGRLTPEFVSSAIRHNDTAGVDYIPSDINLANSETLMQTALSRETILRRILAVDVYNDIFVILNGFPWPVHMLSIFFALIILADLNISSLSSYIKESDGFIIFINASPTKK